MALSLVTQSSARVAAAISSGPTPSPARQATVLTLIHEPPRKSRSCALGLLLGRARAVAGALLLSDVGVCGVWWPRECVLPLEGENQNNREKNEPERRKRRKRRDPRHALGNTSHRPASVHGGCGVVKLQNLKQQEAFATGRRARPNARSR